MATKLHAQWIVGFIDGEGCFRASLIKNTEMRMKTQIQMEFVVTQHKRDAQVLQALKTYFQCGQVTRLKNEAQTNCLRWRVRKRSHLLEIIIPFFEKHLLKTKKAIEFQRFRRLCFLLEKKRHFTEKGFAECIQLAKSIPYEEGASEENMEMEEKKENEWE